MRGCSRYRLEGYRYARAGFPVFQCKPTTTSPLTQNGFTDATSDPACVTNFWTRHPTAMIGMPTGQRSGCFVVDLDIDKQTGKAAGEGTIEGLGLSEDLKTGLLARTPSGGLHAYFAHPGDGFRNTVGKTRGLGPCVDTRRDGGYVILPGSRTAKGGQYSWMDESLLDVGIGGLPDRPFLN